MESRVAECVDAVDAQSSSKHLKHLQVSIQYIMIDGQINAGSVKKPSNFLGLHKQL